MCSMEDIPIVGAILELAVHARSAVVPISRTIFIIGVTRLALLDHAAVAPIAIQRY